MRTEFRTTETRALHHGRVPGCDKIIVEFDPGLPIANIRSFTDERIVMSCFGGSRVYKNANKLKHIGVVAGSSTQVPNRVWLHVNFGRERKVVIDLAPLQGLQIEVEPFQMEDQIVWNIFYTSSIWIISIQLQGGLYRHFTDLLTASTCRSQSEHLYLFSIPWLVGHLVGMTDIITYLLP